MITSKKVLCIQFIFLFLIVFILKAEEVTFTQHTVDSKRYLTLSNSKILCSIEIKDTKLASQTIYLINNKTVEIKSSCNFTIDLMWTGWRVPGKVSNADNLVQFSKQSFDVTDIETVEIPGGGKKLFIKLMSKDNPFSLKLIYEMKPGDFYFKRKLLLSDTTNTGHFLRWLWPVNSTIQGDVEIIKPGGFGQPLALTINSGGAFIGCEYPIAGNYCEKKNEKETLLHCGYECGMKIGADRIESEWVVFGLTPDQRVKLWFNNYLNDIRVAELKPYLLYNSWYDVRSKIYTERPEDIMNEKNLKRIINDFKREMVEEQNLHLDAFVLDDGWDIYESDWQLRKKEFPQGLKPVADELASMGTEMGIWFGPTGGYSYRLKRINWMADQGYEIVGGEAEYHNKMLCLAGEKYRNLFKKRVVDFVKQFDVGYYKWDGIQFSCSESDHGHPVGVYSRRAVMESVIDISSAVREANPDIFLNITSGTWLSPWWLKYANTIWMQGRDYGYAEVPSISKRDAAMTYRDVVLHRNLRVNNFWFPISNLMTHGIIKGHLQKLGGEAEPLDKFTNNALLYFARGVSMWELYVSPNLLTDGEWKAIAQSIRWARDRFKILMNTEMVGGSPTLGEPYGYVHYAGDKGITALRNPSIDTQKIQIILDHALGLCSKARSLVLEKVYPERYISYDLYTSGDTLDIKLQGYETAVYEIYPLSEAEYPLLAGTVFSINEKTNSSVTYTIYNADDKVCLLNPDKVKNKTITIQPQHLSRCGEKVKLIKKDNTIILDFTVNPSVQAASLACLFISDPILKPDPESNNLVVKTVLDGREITPQIQKQKSWQWMKVFVKPGSHKVTMDIISKNQDWHGQMEAWLLGKFKPKPQTVVFRLNEPLEKIRPLPPYAGEKGVMRSNLKLGEVVID